LSHAEAIAALKTRTGTQFDPRLIARFLPMVERLHQQYGSELNRYLTTGAPEREGARHAQTQLRDLVPELTLFEAV
jgi:HD-GYP domain-containing protein (c-di-GMP phosphodiesterase class II)